jgi:hypothetical protein
VFLKLTDIKSIPTRTRGVSQVVERLSSKQKALSSTPLITKNNNNKSYVSLFGNTK